MFGKLSLEQRKALQAILVESGMITRYQNRVDFLTNAGLGKLLNTLPMEEQTSIFAGALVRECERLGAPPSLNNRYATAVLAMALLDEDAIDGNSEAKQSLIGIVRVYEGGSTAPPPPTPAGKTIKILFLASNPANTGKLSLDREFEVVRETLVAAQAQNPSLAIELIQRTNVRNDDISEHLLDVRPHILHFAGHGDLLRSPAEAALSVGPGRWRGLFISNWEESAELSSDEVKPSGIILGTESGSARLISAETLVRLFTIKQINEEIYFVVLNACWAQGQARDLVQRAAVPFAIGMNQPIHDEAAIRFTQGFYRALFRHAAIGDAVESGRFQMEAIGTGDLSVPVLEKRADYDPGFVLIPRP